MRYAAITGWGMYVPQRILTNADLEKLVGASDAWIQARTGIRERRIVAADERTSTMGAAAARHALERAGLAAEEIDLLVVATSSPDQPMPSTAALIQTLIGARRAAPFDVQAAHSGFVYGLVIGTQFIRTGAYKHVLVIGADAVSRFVDFTDRNTGILFGDGAGAVVLSAATGASGVLTFDLGATAGTADLLYVPPLDEGRSIKMHGREVFKHCVRAMADSSIKALEASALRLSDIDLVVPHQANARLIEALAQRLDLSMERVVVNIDRYGNTSAATIPIALAEAADAGRLRTGDNVLLTACGAGLTWGSAVVRWDRP